MRKLLALTVGLAALIGGVSSAYASPQVFVYRGGGYGANPLASFENLLGRHVDGVVDFNDYGQTAGNIVSNANWDLGTWQGKVPNIAYSVGLAVNGTTMAQVAAGALDAQYAAIGASLVSHGFPNAYIRLGWEMNGGWYAWGGKGAAYVAAYNHAAPILKKGCPNCKIVWNPTAGIDPSSEWPGDANVDVIGSDEYANTWNSGGAAGVFGTATTGDFGGYWGFTSFRPGSRGYHTAAHPYAIPEMGVGSRSDGHGACTLTGATSCDDGAFVAAELASAPDAQFIGFWDYNAGDYNSQFSDGSRPNVALAFLQAEGTSQLQTFLKGSKVYTGTFKATTPSVHSFLVQLANGNLALIFWGDGTTAMTVPITFSASRTIGAFHPLDGSTASWGKMTALSYVYTSGLSVVTVSAS